MCLCVCVRVCIVHHTPTTVIGLLAYRGVALLKVAHIRLTSQLAFDRLFLSAITAQEAPPPGTYDVAPSYEAVHGTWPWLPAVLLGTG